jgi:mono/diheme cytochrome c family protein
MRFAWVALLLLAGCTAGSAREAAGPEADAARGELLYGTACAACHTTQAHWRDKRVVHSWGDLIYQVTRWQGVAGQNWSAQEVADVAAYLNRRFYGLPCPTPGCTGPSARAGTEADRALTPVANSGSDPDLGFGL